MKCDRFDDLVACNALLRPGPLDAGHAHASSSSGSWARRRSRYPHPLARGGPRADLRRHHLPGTGDADRERAGRVLARRSRRAPEGGGQEGRGADQEGAGAVRRARRSRRATRGSWWTSSSAQIETFGRYGFNKSHSVAYSVLSYQTAWLKAHYPAEFMAALLSSEIGNTDKVVQYINEARELGLEVLPPDVNESGFKFTVVGDRRIRFGLGAVRNVGGGAIESIIAGARRRPFATLADLVDRHRPPALQQAGARVADRRRRLRLARRPPGAAARRRWTRRSARRSSSSRSGTPARSRSSARSPPERPAHVAAARRAALDRGRAARAGEGGARLLHLRAPAGALPRRGRAVRHPHHRDAGRMERAPGDASAAVVTAVKRQISKKTGQGVRAAHAGGLPRHRGGDRLPRRLGQAEPDHPARRALLLTGGYSARDRGEDAAPVRRRGGPAAGRAPEDRRARADASAGGPQRRDRRT